MDLQARGTNTIVLPRCDLKEGEDRVRQVTQSLLREHGYGDVEVHVE